MKTLRNKKIAKYQAYLFGLIFLSLILTIAFFLYYFHIPMKISSRVGEIDECFAEDFSGARPIKIRTSQLYSIYSENPEEVYALLLKHVDDPKTNIRTRVILLSILFNYKESDIRKKISDNFYKEISVKNYKENPYMAFSIIYPELFTDNNSISQKTIDGIRDDFYKGITYNFIDPIKIIRIRNPAYDADIILPESYTNGVESVSGNSPYVAELIMVNGKKYKVKDGLSGICFSYEDGKWVGQFSWKGQLKGNYTFKVLCTPTENKVDGPTFTLEFENKTGEKQIIIPELHF